MHTELRAWAALAAASLASGVTLAWAQPLDPALAVTRREIIQQALEARGVGDHARALDLAQRAGEIAASPSLRAIIAREAVAMGRWSLALGEAQQCVAEAERDASLPDRDQVLAACRRVADEAQPRVGRVTVQLPATLPEGVRVRVAGAELPRAVWGLAYVVTPGSIEVEVSAPGHETFRQTVEVTQGARVEVPVTLTARPPPPPPPPPPMVVTPPVVAPPRPVVPPAPASRSPGVGPWIVVGAWALSLGLAGAFYGLSDAARAERDAQCDATGCPDSARPAHERYEGFLLATNVALAAGAAAVVGGVTWWLVARLTARPAARRTSLLLTPLAGGVTVGCGGAF